MMFLLPEMNLVTSSTEWCSIHDWTYHIKKQWDKHTMLPYFADIYHHDCFIAHKHYHETHQTFLKDMKNISVQVDLVLGPHTWGCYLLHVSVSFHPQCFYEQHQRWQGMWQWNSNRKVPTAESPRYAVPITLLLKKNQSVETSCHRVPNLHKLTWEFSSSHGQEEPVSPVVLWAEDSTAAEWKIATDLETGLTPS